MSIEEIVSAINSEVYGVWFLIGAALVFWMQAGFAMVEAGFTRPKNTGNIIMKNLMDFCIGTVMWFLIGASLMLPATHGKGLFAGDFSFAVFTQYGDFDYSGFVFNLVFCATTATIVSGAMAERTKFLTYCLYSAIISGIIYPIEAHWTWGGGFLAQWGFHDYAGSACIHMVGGICALVGAWMLGPRIGKFGKDKNGKITSVHAFPGHSITIGALGVFILWLGWYGFNGRRDRRSDARLRLPHHNGRPGCRYRCLHDLHLDQVRQAGCLHVPQCFPRRSRRHHGSLRCDGLRRRCRHRRCLGRARGLRRLVPRQQAACR